jgi:hypothetical protein
MLAVVWQQPRPKLPEVQVPRMLRVLHPSSATYDTRAVESSVPARSTSTSASLAIVLELVPERLQLRVVRLVVRQQPGKKLPAL